jgi:rod shape-determining protein MreC
MYNIIKLIISYHFLLLFVIIEIISFALIINFNKHQNVVFLSSANSISGSFNNSIYKINEYFYLKSENETLLKQNNFLLSKFKTNYLSNKQIFNVVEDTVYEQQYKYTQANVIQNSVYNKHNYLTINKGKINGIITECAVVCSSGIVGIVSKSSKNFSNVVSVLNTDLNISAKIKKNNYFGSLKWDGVDYQIAKLNEIPFHVKLQIGDTIVTSSYSLIFPENILIGTIFSFNKVAGGDFYDINVKLSTDFKNVRDVNIITNLKKMEIQNLTNNGK